MANRLRLSFSAALYAAFALCAGCEVQHPNWLVPTDAGVPADSDSGNSGHGGGGAGGGGTGASGAGSGGSSAGSGGGGTGGTHAQDDGGVPAPVKVKAGLWITGGGGNVVSADHRARLVIGEPQPIGDMNSADHRARFGAAAAAAQQFP